MAIEITVTEAGIAALVNAANTGTDPVTITQIGLSQTAVVPAKTLTALSGEFKRIDGVGGSVVAPDTIHISAIDDSADAYSLRSFALYLGDGTLFAIYGQPSQILSKAEAAFVGLAIDVIFADIDTALLEFGATDFLLPQATTEARGTIELATLAEAQAGIDALRALTPANAKAAILGWLLAQDGAGSGLDADLLDGLQATDFLRRNHGPRPFDFNHNNGTAQITASAGTWATGYHFRGNAGADLGGFGCYGSGDTRSFFYVGAAFNAPNTLKIGVSNISFNESFIWHAGNDGAGSGLDADLLDGLQATAFLRLGHGNRPFNYEYNGASYLTASAGGWIMGHYFRGSGGTALGGLGAYGNTDSLFYYFVGPDHASGNALRILPDRPAWGSNVIWHAANDGAGSGLDADLLDGQHGSYYADIAARLGYTPLNAASYTAADVRTKLLTVDGAGSGVDADLLDGHDWGSGANAVFGICEGATPGTGVTGGFRLRANAGSGQAWFQVTNPNGTVHWGGWNYDVSGKADWHGTSLRRASNLVWDLGNDGAGSGLDADLLDGLDSSQFMRSDTLSGGATSGKIQIGPLTLTWRDISVLSNQTQTHNYGAGHTYSSWARAWVDGDDGSGDRSVSVVGHGTSQATVRSSTNTTASVVLFSIGV
jgi:hypothetical protein